MSIYAGYVGKKGVAERIPEEDFGYTDPNNLFHKQPVTKF